MTGREAYMAMARVAILTCNDRETFVDWWKKEAPLRFLAGLTKEDEAELAARIKRQIAK